MVRYAYAVGASLVLFYILPFHLGNLYPSLLIACQVAIQKQALISAVRLLAIKDNLFRGKAGIRVLSPKRARRPRFAIPEAFKRCASDR